MATGAFAGTVEISFPSIDVSGLQVGDVDATSTSRVGSGQLGLGVNECHQVGHFRVGEVELGHLALGASIANYRGDIAAIYVFSNQFRAGEVWTGLAAACVSSVAKGAILKVSQSARDGWGARACGYGDCGGRCCLSWSARRHEGRV